jgi:1-acyl-sn-glycerol-3-phosphate acyltransferase
VRLRNWVIWSVTPPVIRGVSRALWRLRVEGEADLPGPPFVVAANHYSFLDPLLVGAIIPERIQFIGLSDLVGNYRAVDLAIDTFGMIQVTRGKVPLGAMRQALACLVSGGVVGLFPEGTRHWTFDPANALPGAAWLATRADVPLLCVAIRGTDRVLGVDNKLHRGRIQVVVGPALRHRGEGREAVDDLTRRWGEWVAPRLEATIP